jgi:tetratricopeptide (TPR) repeat protein
MGSLHQQRAEGELVLEQNDGIRRIYWSGGDLVYLRSDAVGEQFGNFLIRRGVLDMASLKELLADGEGARMGDRVVQWGLMTVEERDSRLHELLGSVLLHAMEHTILKMTWIPGVLDENLSGDLQFRLDHRRLVWDTFQSAKVGHELEEMFRSEPDWRWEARPDLLVSLSDLPLTPALAYALSLLGSEPLGYETIGSLSGLPPEDSARLVATLWALGGLNLVRGDLPLLPKEPLAAVPAPGLPPAPEPVVEPEAFLEPEMDAEPIILIQEDLFPPPLAHTPKSLPMPPAEALEQAFSEPLPMTLPLLPSRAEEETLSAPDRAHRLVVKAKSYQMQNRTSEAIRALEQSIKLDGESPAAYEAWLLLGRLRLGNPAWSTRAVEALQVASRIRPQAAEPWALMGELYDRKGFHANAQGCFRRALDLDPSVAVPSGYDGEEAEGGRDGHGGLMGRLRAMLGREKN